MTIYTATAADGSGHTRTSNREYAFAVLVNSSRTGRTDVEGWGAWGFSGSRVNAEKMARDAGKCYRQVDVVPVVATSEVKRTTDEVRVQIHMAAVENGWTREADTRGWGELLVRGDRRITVAYTPGGRVREVYELRGGEYHRGLRGSQDGSPAEKLATLLGWLAETDPAAELVTDIETAHTEALATNAVRGTKVIRKCDGLPGVVVAAFAGNSAFGPGWVVDLGRTADDTWSGALDAWKVIEPEPAAGDFDCCAESSEPPARLTNPAANPVNQALTAALHTEQAGPSDAVKSFWQHTPEAEQPYTQQDAQRDEVAERLAEKRAKFAERYGNTPPAVPEQSQGRVQLQHPQTRQLAMHKRCGDVETSLREHLAAAKVWGRVRSIAAMPAEPVTSVHVYVTSATARLDADAPEHQALRLALHSWRPSTRVEYITDSGAARYVVTIDPSEPLDWSDVPAQGSTAEKLARPFANSTLGETIEQAIKAGWDAAPQTLVGWPANTLPVTTRKAIAEHVARALFGGN